jgi:hypothetical protein
MRKTEKRFEGEARLLRAFYYLELIKNNMVLPGSLFFLQNLWIPCDFWLCRANFNQECADFIAAEWFGDCKSWMPIRIIENKSVGVSVYCSMHQITSSLYNASPYGIKVTIMANGRYVTASKKCLNALTIGGEISTSSWLWRILNYAAPIKPHREIETTYEINLGAPSYF